MLDQLSLRNLTCVVDEVLGGGTVKQLAALAGPGAGPDNISAVADECFFDHGSVLLFPDDTSDVAACLRSRGFDVTGPVASVVVRERLAQRYGLREDDLDVSILHGTIRLASGVRRGVEVFCVPRKGAPAAMMAREERERNESHVAFKVGNPAPAALNRLRSILLDRFSMRPDGGGYNPFDDAAAGGRTVLYFSTVGGRRMELTCAGHFAEVIDAHRGSAEGDPHRALLSILTGHWAARAVYVAARLGIADALAGGPLTADEVAARLGCDPAATVRLLRYLSRLDVVLSIRGVGESRYVTGATGGLLRSDNPFRDLVLLYGEEFYRAWDTLLPAVQQGKSAFGLAFGEEHFDYFARNPEVGRRFDRSMAAVTDLVAARICAAYDFSKCSTVVDVGGGNGTLLNAVLRDNLDVTGILVDRAHVTDGVSGDAEVGDRLTSLSGDFFDSVPGGHDVYLLSRVLHDWSDEDCLRILRVCRTACPEDAALLVLERVLTDDGDDSPYSLAVPWDMQMLAVTGGQERTRNEFGRLLRDAGFELDDVRSLPLDMKLLVARPV